MYLWPPVCIKPIVEGQVESRVDSSHLSSLILSSLGLNLYAPSQSSSALLLKISVGSKNTILRFLLIFIKYLLIQKELTAWITYAISNLII